LPKEDHQVVITADVHPKAPPPTSNLAAYARGFAERAPHTAWLLGAGASADASVPTASQFVDQLLARRYCTEHQVLPEALRSDSRWRERVRAAYDGVGGLPRFHDPAFYSELFVHTFQDRDARARFVLDQCRGRTPHVGQHILAGLVAAKQAPLLITTNFDTLLEDAINPMMQGSDQHLTTLFPESADMARFTAAIDAQPLLLKIHGTMGAVTLSNTTDELAEHDKELRDAVVSRLSRFGLIVVGYSGRDPVVMQMLDSVLDNANPYPSGFTWVSRPEDDLPDSVTSLLDRARGKGIEPVYHLIASSMVDLMTHVECAVELPADLRTKIAANRPRPLRTPAAAPGGPTSPYPQLRIAALPILALPTTARLLTDPRNTPIRETRSALRTAHAHGMVARRRGGQLVAFGNDTELQAALNPLGINVTGETVTIGEDPDGADRPDSADAGIYSELLARALGRTHGVGEVLRSNHRHQLRVRESAGGTSSLPPALRGLREQVGTLTGSISGPHGSTLPWAEALTIGLDWRDGQCWLLFAPDIWLRQNLVNPPTNMDDSAQHARATRLGGEFVRDRLAGRYNNKTTAILTAWLTLLIAGADGDQRTVHAFQLADRPGVEATFSFGVRPLTSQRLLDVRNG
jgi:hypothetical protein